MKQYPVKEIFRTLQGEGAQYGTPSIFVRFGGCNLWSGFQEDRERDVARTGSACPLFCDTDFANPDKLTLEQIIEMMLGCGAAYVPLIVLTGGEPLLSVDANLLHSIKRNFKNAKIAIETNGTVKLKEDYVPLIDWICVSPKLPVDQLVITSGDELKVVFPAYNPLSYSSIAKNFTHNFVSPQASSGKRSVIDHDNVQKAVVFVSEHTKWRLSLQNHKILQIP